MLDLRRLRLLKEFAERGTITATAAALGYTPSAVSQQLAALEREAGTALRARTPGSAELPDAGLRLAGHAESILAAVEEAEADLSVQAREPSGRVSVAAFPSAAAAFAPALARSLRVHPGLTLLLRQTPRVEGLRQVSSAEVDVALVDDWSGGLADTEPSLLRFYPPVRDPLVLVVPRGHRLADPAEPVDLRQVREERRGMGGPARGTVRAGRGPAARQGRRRSARAVGVRGPRHHPQPRSQGHRHRRRAPAGPGRRGGAGRRARTAGGQPGARGLCGGTGGQCPPSFRGRHPDRAARRRQAPARPQRRRPHLTPTRRAETAQGSRSSGQLMQRGPPRPRPSSLPRTGITSMPFSRR